MLGYIRSTLEGRYLMPMSIKFKGGKELIQGFTELRQFKAVRAAVKAGAQHVKGKLDQAPPETLGNKSGPYPKRWYQRNYGPKWALAGGGAGGDKTSENLTKNWGIRFYDNGFSAAIGNSVTYAKYVHDSKEQNIYHKAHGWMTDEDVVDNEGPHVRNLIDKVIERQLNSI